MAEHRDDELAREIRTHLETEAEDRMANGETEAEARFAARRAFGNVAHAQEDARAVWTRRWLEDLRSDGLTPLDPVTFVSVPFLFAVVAAVATLIPARRATRVNPMVALRCE